MAIQILIRTQAIGGTTSGLSGLTKPGRTRRIASYRTSPTGAFYRLPMPVAEKALRAGTISYGTLQGRVVTAFHTPTHSELQRACDCELGVPALRDLHGKVSNLVDSARVNANDTVYTEKNQPESAWESVFLGSLESELANDVDATPSARDWFKAHGVTF